jgi:hypothetical protein
MLKKIKKCLTLPGEDNITPSNGFDLVGIVINGLITNAKRWEIIRVILGHIGLIL